MTSSFNWQKENVPTGSYIGLASSSNGIYLMAIHYDSTGGFVNPNPPNTIYRSSDSGTTWTLSNASANSYSCITCDASSINVFVGNSNVTTDGIYKSTDGGLNFTLLSNSTKGINSIASSANGMVIIAGQTGNGGYIYISTSGGVGSNPWTQIISGGLPSSGIGVWRGVTTDTTGTYFSAINNGGKIYNSSNQGTTWTVGTGLPVTSSWQSISTTESGLNLVASDTNNVYFSSNRGSSWSVLTNAPTLNWISLTIDNSGNYIAGVSASSPYIYICYDISGQWVPQINNINIQSNQESFTPFYFSNADFKNFSNNLRVSCIKIYNEIFTLYIFHN
jgi:hypothetical protein